MASLFVTMEQAEGVVVRVFGEVLDRDDLGRQERDRLVALRGEVQGELWRFAVDSMAVANLALGLAGFSPVPQGPQHSGAGGPGQGQAAAGAAWTAR